MVLVKYLLQLLLANCTTLTIELHKLVDLLVDFIEDVEQPVRIGVYQLHLHTLETLVDDADGLVQESAVVQQLHALLEVHVGCYDLPGDAASRRLLSRLNLL